MADKNMERVRLLQSMAQTGLEYARDPYDRDRYRKILTVASEMAADSMAGTPGEIEMIYSREKGYATPKVDVRAVVFREGKVLLVREKSDGCWTLPGGWADVGDSPAESVTREVLEESGFVTRAVKVLAVLDRNKHGHTENLFHIYKIYLLCEITGGSARPSDETSEVGFFSEEELPELSRQRITRGQLAIMFEHYRDPGRPADFD